MSELAAAALDDFLNILGKKKVEVKVEEGWGRLRLEERLRLRLSGEARKEDASEMTKFRSLLNLNLSLNLPILE